MTTNDQQSVSLREFFDEKFKRLEEQNELSIQQGNAMLKKQDETNGRVRASEVAIAVLQVGATAGYVLFGAVLAWFFSKLP